MRAACLLLLLGIVTAGVSAVAQTPDRAALVISTGREGGSYHAIGQRLRTALEAKGRRAKVRTSPGSLENLKRLDDSESPVGVALTQSDALMIYLANRPGFADEFFLLGDVGQECMFLVTGSWHAAATLAEIATGPAGGVAVDEAGSGAALTLSHLSRLDPALRNLRPMDLGPLEGLEQLAAHGADGALRAVMLVQRPTRRSPPLEHLLAHPESYRLIPIREGDVPHAALPDGSSVYSFDRVSLGGAGSPPALAVDTLCMRGLMLGSVDKLDAELRQDLTSVMLESGRRIIGTTE